MKLSIKALGLACGIIWGLAIFLLTYWFLLRGFEGETLSRLGNLYLGYSVTWYGGFIGLVWGFIDGFIGGTVLAWLYNRFACKEVEGGKIATA
ncbi:bacteriophage holin [Candidatus Neomarinimicrobiota bacterium]